MSSSLHQINPLQLGCNGIDWWERWSCSAARSKLFSFSSQSNKRKFTFFIWWKRRKVQLFFLFFFSSWRLPAGRRKKFDCWSWMKQQAAPFNQSNLFSFQPAERPLEPRREEEVNSWMGWFVAVGQRPPITHHRALRCKQRKERAAGKGPAGDSTNQQEEQQPQQAAAGLFFFSAKKEIKLSSFCGACATAKGGVLAKTKRKII